MAPTPELCPSLLPLHNYQSHSGYTDSAFCWSFSETAICLLLASQMCFSALPRLHFPFLKYLVSLLCSVKSKDSYTENSDQFLTTCFLVTINVLLFEASFWLNKGLWESMQEQVESGGSLKCAGHITCRWTAYWSLPKKYLLMGGKHSTAMISQGILIS